MSCLEKMTDQPMFSVSLYQKENNTWARVGMEFLLEFNTFVYYIDKIAL